MRYVWDTGAEYFRFGRGLLRKRMALALIAPALRAFDRWTAAGVDFFIANSENVRHRVRCCYGRGATVIYPPVNTDFFTPERSAEGEYYLAVSSLEPYKRIDVAVDAFSGGKRRLLIAGAGSLAAQLRARARPPVEFLGAVDDNRLRELYRNCRALVFPGLEDFGMVPVEAQACGRPVIAYGQGGAVETVLPGITGVHFRPQTASALIEAVEQFEGMDWDRAEIRSHSLCFSRHIFRERMRAFLRDGAIRSPISDECRCPTGARADF